MFGRINPDVHSLENGHVHTTGDARLQSGMVTEVQKPESGRGEGFQLISEERAITEHQHLQPPMK